MRLRNRQVNAEFWTDPDLLRDAREKRLTYLGLAALCEDSGCLEYDPWSIKLILWPSPVDADITEPILAAWLDDWIGSGKFVIYEADGKRYLFMLHFHDYQKPRNPQSPNLPLPEWVEWVTNEKDPRKGRYEYHRDLLESSTNVVLPSNNGCPPRGGLASSGLAWPGVAKGTTASPSTALPPCLDIPCPYVKEYPDTTVAGAILREADAHFRWQGGKAIERNALVAVFIAGCFPECSKSAEQANDCCATAFKALDKCSGSWAKSRGLFATITTEDREVQR